MNRYRFYIVALTLILAACQSLSDKNTIGGLRHKKIEIKEEKIEGGLDKAMQGYQRFLEETPESNLTPEAIRRLADLKIEKEYGTITGDADAAGTAAPSEKTATRTKAASETATMETPNKNKTGVAAADKTAALLPAPERAVPSADAAAGGKTSDQALAHIPRHAESEKDFEKRATQKQSVPAAAETDALPEGVNDLERANAREAIALYKKLLNDYPLYDRNDQVLYQMSRAYEELGQTEEAMAVMDRMVREYGRSRYIDEVQFRRAEHFFAHKHYMDAEEAYTSVVNIGVSSSYYELALYKLGWTFYKQELYEDGLHKFIALMDHKVAIGYDFEQTEDETEQKRMQDTFRVISLSFSNLGGPDSVVEYFKRYGKRSYEDKVYSNLGEFYFDKRRYADASASYNAFIKRNPFHKVAPNFHMRVIEIHAAGGFPSLVLEAKKSFADTYGLKAEYWKYFDPGERPDVLGHLKTNLIDLANHYHASYQKPRKAEEKPANFREALHWYREFLVSFPKETESPVINYQLADLLLENKSFGLSAVEYEKTAYGYPAHEKSSQAGYAAVYAYREHLASVKEENKDKVKREVVRSSLKFADTFPKHEKAALVLGAAADDLFSMQEFERALAAATKLHKVFPKADSGIIRSAWLVIGHSSYELQRYKEAETAYLKVLSMLPAEDKTRDTLVDNLAASIYKQGELADAAQDYKAAAHHYLRISRMAPTSKIRATAEYDGAAALIQLKDWEAAAKVLVGFRSAFPGHELQPEVTKKIAFVYRENGQLSMAANEYERIEKESEDDNIRREALLTAAELHQKDGNDARALEVYRRYVGYFPQPVDLNIETRNKMAEILKAQNNRKSYLNELMQIVSIDAAAGQARTPRTRYLAANACLVLAEDKYDQFVAVQLKKPFKVNLAKKRKLMKAATNDFNKLIDYEIGETTAAATFYMAEMFAHFSKALMTSERPEGLSPLELEQYELAIEEQAYPFEEKAIAVHESNMKLIAKGVYNEWVDKSLQKLAVLMPARYAKTEESSSIVNSLDTYIFEIARPTVSKPQAAESAGAEPKEDKSAGGGTESTTQTSDHAVVDQAAQLKDGLKTPSEDAVQ
jgi:tetratricopeptide (TPR) repeat protein